MNKGHGTEGMSEGVGTHSSRQCPGGCLPEDHPLLVSSSTNSHSLRAESLGWLLLEAPRECLCMSLGAPGGGDNPLRPLVRGCMIRLCLCHHMASPVRLSNLL